ncbi:MAG: hypothetical protein IPO70_03450 [Bacteroidetes bacterium]|nr:hypothetical protein [Bacteroidota bacterium]
MIDGMQDVVDIGTAAGSKIKGITFGGKTSVQQYKIPTGGTIYCLWYLHRCENPKIAIGIMLENAVKLSSELQLQ